MSPLLLETRAVSAKTPRDGKLEVAPETAERLALFGRDFPLETPAASGRARLGTMACTCAKGKGATHIHHFVESVLLMALVPGTLVRIEIEESGPRLRIALAPVN
jgi:hypothetical protein